MTTKDPQVTTAVEFLGEVAEKGHKESELRKYLKYRRSMSTEQVNEAFKIHNSRMRAKQERERGDRPEVRSAYATTKPSNELTFLLPQHRAHARSLVKTFLKTEYNYCSVLDCLNLEYYKQLGELADRGKIRISRNELEPIFHRLSQLCKFHREFYDEISRRKTNYGQMFVRHFSCFRDYVEYMKDCNFATKKMREYIHDKKLRRYLEQIRITSRRPNDDMMDLIVTPLDRMKDYRDFLDNLYRYADKAQDSDYTFLGKASRRIGRIVDWIEMYKHTIINRNEMNKVQQFLEKQCTIISPKRRIVRRGLMTRRTTSWPARNKHYVFFLFNDVLLWTTRKGELQNLVFLRDCEIRTSSSKTNATRKFEVLATGTEYKYQKLLKLECQEVRQRNEWYKVMEKEIALAKKTTGKNSKPSSPMEEDLANYITTMADNAPDCVTPPPKTQNTVEQKEEEANDIPVEPEDEEGLISPGHRRYQYSRNFEAQEFSGSFLPLDDMSVISETDQDNMLLDSQAKYGDSMGALFPNTESPSASRENSKRSINRIQRQTKVKEEIFTRGNSSASLIERSNSDEWGSPHGRSPGSSPSARAERREPSARQKKTNIIRLKGTPLVDELKSQSSCTFSLNDY